MSEPGVDVLLVSAPFGPLYQPSLALGILAACTPDLRVCTWHLTFPFAERIGAELYTTIADGIPTPSLLCGEWVFGAPVEPAKVGAYLGLVAAARGTPAALRDGLVAARSAAGAFVEEQARRIVALAPRVVGFTSTFQQQAATVALARRIKELAPGIAILVGGANVEGVMGPALLRAFPCVDVVLSGEGEPAFAALCARLLAHGPPWELEGLPGVSSREVSNAPGHVADMDAIPLPRFDEFFEQWRASPVSRDASPRLVLETSRGCWWGQKQHCTFCGLNGDSMAFRAKSSSRALDEIVSLSERHGVTDVLMTDDILSPVHLREVLPRLAEMERGLTLFYEVKANLTRAQLLTMRLAGVTDIQPGIESLSDPILASMKKGVTALQNVQLLKWCVEIGIHPWWNLLWGFPGEPPDEYARMAALVPLLAHLPPPDGDGNIRLDRFSPCFEEAEAMGFVEVRPAPAYAHVYDLPGSELAELAYHFVGDHRDGRDVAAYVAPLSEAIVKWRQVHADSVLAYTDDGERTLVADYRPCARRPASLLGGAARELYLACDAIRSVPELARLLRIPATDVEEIAEPLVHDGLLLRDGPRLLALAVRAADLQGEAE